MQCPSCGSVFRSEATTEAASRPAASAAAGGVISIDEHPAAVFELREMLCRVLGFMSAAMMLDEAPSADLKGRSSFLEGEVAGLLRRGRIDQP